MYRVESIETKTDDNMKYDIWNETCNRPAHIPRFNQRPFQAPDSRSHLRPHARVSPTKVFKSILYRKGLPCSIKIGEHQSKNWST